MHPEFGLHLTFSLKLFSKMFIVKRYTVLFICSVLVYIFSWRDSLDLRKMLKVYPDTHIKVLTKEHFSNRCLHGEDNTPHKYQNGTLEKEKQ